MMVSCRSGGIARVLADDFSKLHATKFMPQKCGEAPEPVAKITVKEVLRKGVAVTG